ncbi:MAG: TatD family hydrolase [Myxococcota bacterium]|jgi:TatD DNase family protein|nr:TatD family hydrolase [Myxococcota bacterium]
MQSSETQTPSSCPLIDAHCHLDHWWPDLHGVLERAQQRSVVGVMMAGVELENWQLQSRIASCFSNVFSVFGVHPQKLSEFPGEPSSSDWRAALDTQQLALEQRLRAKDSHCDRLIALGETGLDRSRPEYRAVFPQQLELFRLQLALSREYNLPVVLHILEAHGAALEVLRGDGLPAAGALLHSYSGPAEMVPAYAALGLRFSFSAAVLRPDARKTHRAAAAVPREALLVETDAPFQSAPQLQTSERPHSLRNEPGELPAILRGLAQVRNEDAEALAKEVFRNTVELFQLQDKIKLSSSYFS